MAKLKLSSVKADLDRENNGAWIDYPQWKDPDTGECARFKVRALHYQGYQVARSQMFQRWTARYGEEVIPPEVLFKDIGKLLVEHILLDWDIDAPFAEAIDVMCDPSYREVQAAVEWCAARVSVITPKFDEAAAKN